MTAEASDPPAAPPSDAPVVTSEEMLRGARELLIQHGTQTYRLRLTDTGKLILTK